MYRKNQINIKLIRIFENIFYKIFLSVCVLLLLILVGGFTNIKENMNISYFAKCFSSVLPNDFNISFDQEVSSNISFDHINYKDNINIITNYSTNGVLNLIDGIIIKIERNNNLLFNVFVQSSDGLTYCYQNLESVSMGIYSFIESGTLLGSLPYDSEIDGYQYELIISKNKEYFRLYEIWKSEN